MGVKDLILDLLYPPKCVVCERILERGERDLCPTCRRTLVQVTKPLPKPALVADVAAVFIYDDVLRPSLLRYKFHGRVCYASSYGPMLAEKIRDQGLEFDLLTWVPISRRRRWKRGYDQAKQLAVETAKALGVPAVPTLRKIRDNPPQAKIRDEAQRRANVSGVYQVLPAAQLRDKRVLLIDDIMTTGATLGEAALMLRTAHAGSVQAAVFAAARRAK